MPSQPSHIPNSRERSVLQALLANESHAQYLAVANPQSIETMIRKGWIVRTAPKKLAITDAGKTALAEPLRY